MAKSIPIRPAVIAIPSGVHDKGCAAAQNDQIAAISKPQHFDGRDRDGESQS